MATSGQTKQIVTPDGYIHLLFTWSVASQNIDNNSTTIKWDLKLVSTNANANIISSQPKQITVRINNKQVTGGTVSVNLNGGQTRTLASGTETIAHNSDGSKSFAYSFSQQFDITYSGNFIGTITANGSGTLDTIPRATVPKASVTTQTLGQAITITLNRASASFTHTLKISIGSHKETLAQNVAVSHTWTPPLTLANQIPNALTGLCVLTCETYNGSKLIGSKNITITLKVPLSIVPLISSVDFTEVTTGIKNKFGAFIKDKSVIQGVINASAQYGATIKVYKAEFLGLAYTTKTFKTAIVSQSGKIPCKVTVVDSRGISATTTLEVEVLDYTNPTIHNFEARRCNADGTINDEGEHLSIALNFTIESVNGKNDKSYVIDYKPTAETAFTTISEGSDYVVNKTIVTGKIVSADESYTLRLRLSDYFKEIELTNDVPTAFTLIDYNESGRGMAIGKVSQDDTFDVAIPARFRDRVDFKDDCEWTMAIMDPKFKAYYDNPDNLPKYRIRNRVIEIRGVVSPKVQYKSDATQVPFAKIPAELAPANNLYQICLGSGKETWELCLLKTGELTISRYGLTAFADVLTNARLVFTLTYTLD